jgi:DNA-binding IclR family transcriptional regulator
MRRDPIKSAARTLEILELFHERRTPLRLTDIFEKLSYPQSSTTALLKSMVVLGYLNYDRVGRTYFPTPKVAALGDWVNHHLFGTGELLRLMAAVFEQTDETVVISAQNDIFIQHVRVLQPAHAFKLPPTEGSMRLLTHSAAGLVLMSQMAPKAVDKLCRHINAHETDRTKRVDLDELVEQLQWIRREGYSLLAGFPLPEAAAIAIPLPRSAHGAPLTLGVGGLNSRIARSRSDILRTMRQAVAAYEGKLRADPDQGVALDEQDLHPADYPLNASPASPNALHPPSTLTVEPVM